MISFWFTRGADCLPTQDVVDGVARRYRGRVNFLSIDVRDDRDEARSASSPSAAGRCRSAGTPTGRSPTSTGSAAARRVAFAYPGRHPRRREDRAATSSPTAQLTADVERLLRAVATPGGEPVSR